MQQGGVSGQGLPGTAGSPPGNPGRPVSEAGQPPEEAPAEREPRRGPVDFIRRLLRPQSAPPEPDPSAEEGPTGGGADDRPAPGPPPGTGGRIGGSAPSTGGQRQGRPGATGPDGDSESVTLTRAQLAEMVNGEVNRREAKKLAEAERARRRQLRDADPIGYADEEREREVVEDAQAAQAERMRQSLAYYDQHTLMPFLNKLPPDVVDRLRQETGGGVEGLEGRARLMERAQELLEERVRADERTRLRGGNGQGRSASGGTALTPLSGSSSTVARALQKQQLLREAEADVAPEPEVLGPGGGVAPPADGPDMNTQLRALLAGGRTRR